MRQHRQHGRIVHFHIPKTAGISLVRLILQSRRIGERRRPWQNGGHVQFYDHVPMKYGRQATLWLARHAEFVSGHFHWGSYLAMRPRPDDRLITFLRDPVERLRSSFRFARSLGYSVPPLPSLDLATMTFEDFLSREDPGWRMHVDNMAVRLLAGQYGEEPGSDAEWQRLTQSAIDHLQRFAFVGLTERMDACLEELRTYFGTPIPPAMFRENATPEAARLSAAADEDIGSDQVRRLLHQCTKYDRILYDCVSNNSMVAEAQAA